MAKGRSKAQPEGRKREVPAGQRFEDITDRLDQIVSEVRSKDVSLERSLDLLDEAIALGSEAVGLVDATELSDAEKARLGGDDEGSDGGGRADEAAAAVGEGPSAAKDDDVAPVGGAEPTTDTAGA